jgi:serine phosphatase RsbU (regulator of sigma subunit)
MKILADRGVMQRITQALVRNPSWKIIVRNNSWLCPYCAKIGARQLSMEEQIEGRIATHLLEECERCQNFTGAELSLDDLRRSAKLIVFKVQVGKWMLGDRRYSMATDDGVWICPCCGVVTDIAMPEGDPREAATYGEMAEEHPYLNSVSKHFLQCTSFEKQQVLSQQELDAIKAKIDRQARSGRVQERFAKEPEWQLVDQERRWLCPFCVSVTGAIFPAEGPNESFYKALGEHLLTCKSYRVLRGKPRPVKYLKERMAARAQARQIAALKQKVEARPIWRCIDSEARWYCPYCAESDQLKFPRGQEHNAEAMASFSESVLAHLQRCRGYKSKGAIRSQEEMDAVLASADARLRSKRDLRAYMQGDARFQVVTPDRAWVCPYCVTTVPGVELDQLTRVVADDRAFDGIADEILDHFKGCRGYTPGRPPKASLDEVQTEMFQYSQELNTGELGVTQITKEWAKLKQQVELLASEEESGEALLASLENAKATRKRLLPNLPSINGYHFAAEQIAAEQLGGDFYDFFQVNDQVLGVVVGGMSDQGVEATLTMGLTKKLLQSHGRRMRSCVEVLSCVNREIYEELDEDTVISVFFGFLNIQSRAFMFARAGQNPLVVYNPQRTPRLTSFPTRGMPLGSDEGPLFDKSLEQRSIQLAAGDVILQYSAGVTNARNERGEPFGQERLHMLLDRYGQEDTEYLTWKLRKAAQQWQGDRAGNEDMTLVAVKLL